MITNTSLQKWNRLTKKQLNQQFIQEIIRGMNCSTFEAKAILEVTHRVFGSYFELNSSLKPGQMYIQVISAEAPPNSDLNESRLITVAVTIDGGEEDLEVKRNEGVVGLRRHRMQRICEETFQQGGLMTVEDLANRIFNCGERTIARDLKYFKGKGTMLPLRSIVKDMGRTISHRVSIVQEWLKGKEYTEISDKLYHSVSAVQNYVTKFKQVVVLSEQNFDVNTISFLVRLSPTLVEQYYTIYTTSDIIEHRRNELSTFLKETTIEDKGEKRDD